MRSTDQPSTTRNIVASVLVGGALLWCACFVFGLIFSSSAESSSRAGQFGDTFGVVNALFTMAAMVGASFAVRYQWEELTESRATKEQDLREQRFFQLIDLLHAANAGVQVRGDGNYENRIYIAGYRAFSIAMSRYSEPNDVVSAGFEEAIAGCYQWLSMVEALLEFVSDSKGNQKSFFQKVTRAQFSSPQVTFLTVVANFKVGYESLGSTLKEIGLWDRTISG